MAHDAFDEFDEPVNSDMEPEDTRRLVLGDELTEKSPDAIEPLLDI
jgi:hypothetical protein